MVMVEILLQQLLFLVVFEENGVFFLLIRNYTPRGILILSMWRKFGLFFLMFSINSCFFTCIRWDRWSIIIIHYTSLYHLAVAHSHDSRYTLQIESGHLGHLYVWKIDAWIVKQDILHWVWKVNSKIKKSVYPMGYKT